jgi:hypothetical protein
LGPKTEVKCARLHVRFMPINRHPQRGQAYPLCAILLKKLEDVVVTKISPTNVISGLFRRDPAPGGYEGPWSILC